MGNKKIKRDIEKYIKTLKIFLRRSPSKSKIKLGNPNDKHLRTYIKNIYFIKLLYPNTLNIELSHDRTRVNKFILEYNKNPDKIINSAFNKLNKTKKFVIKNG